MKRMFRFLILSAAIASGVNSVSTPSLADAPPEIDVVYPVREGMRRIDEGTHEKFDSEPCPSGYHVIAGGHRIIDVGSGDPNKIYVWWSWPDPQQGVWSTHVRNSADPVPGTAPMVKVEVTAICLSAEP